MSSYSIKDLEQLSGIKAHTLRMWEQRYAVIQPRRTDTNIRTYNENDLKLVLNIALLKEYGYKISAIAKMSTQDIHQKIMDLSESQLHYPDQIHALTLCMLDLDEDQFDKIIQTNVVKFGFESLILHIIYPFLKRINTLWMTGRIGSAQEHFITSLIRQKIIVAIDGQVNKQRDGAHKFLLFLPEGEFQEIHLLSVDYLLRSRHHKVIYLGPNLPFEELGLAYEMHKPEYIFTFIRTIPDYEEFQHYIHKLSRAFPYSRILMVSQQIIEWPFIVPSNVKLVCSIPELLPLINA